MIRSCTNNNGEKKIGYDLWFSKIYYHYFFWFFSDETKKLKQDLQGPSENNDWKAQCLLLQDQIGKKIAFKR